MSRPVFRPPCCLQLGSNGGKVHCDKAAAGSLVEVCFLPAGIQGVALDGELAIGKAGRQLGQAEGNDTAGAW